MTDSGTLLYFQSISSLPLFVVFFLFFLPLSLLAYSLLVMHLDRVLEELPLPLKINVLICFQFFKDNRRIAVN